jgi:KDO2-lipid IV(A) lauroyltransferase
MINKGLSRLGAFFLYLVSLLPFWFLYLISDLLFVILYHIFGYRRKVVQENLLHSFPEKSDEERRSIEKKFFKYLADLIMESIKAITISPKENLRRMKGINPELIEYYFSQGKSIVAATGHYGNWEMAALSFGLVTDKKRMVVYKPLSNAIFDETFNKTRSRFGTTMVSMKQIFRKMVETKNELTFTVFLSDQTPTKHEAQYFTSFLNQPTAVFLGMEKLAQIGDAVVVFLRLEVVKRGYYTGTIVPLVEDPKNSKPFEITESHVKYLESIIREKPEYWLWSHKRWKIKPEDIQK